MSASLAVGTRVTFLTPPERYEIVRSVGFGVLLPAPKCFTDVEEHH